MRLGGHVRVRFWRLGVTGRPAVVRGGRRFQVRGSCSGRRGGRCPGSARREGSQTFEPVEREWANGARVARCRRTRRPVRARVAGIVKSRNRSALGSHRRASCPCRASVCIQAVISAASATTAHQMPVRGEGVQGQVGQAGVLGQADPVLAARPAPVAQLEVGELASSGVGDERGDAHAVDVLEAQLGAGVGSFLAHDHAHPVPASPVRSIRSVSSATQAPSRTASSAS